MGYDPSYKWTNPTYPIYNQGYNPLTKWDEPPSGNLRITNGGKLRHGNLRNTNGELSETQRFSWDDQLLKWDLTMIHRILNQQWGDVVYIYIYIHGYITDKS